MKDHGDSLKFEMHSKSTTKLTRIKIMWTDVVPALPVSKSRDSGVPVSVRDKGKPAAATDRPGRGKCRAPRHRRLRTYRGKAPDGPPTQVRTVSAAGGDECWTGEDDSRPV